MKVLTKQTTPTGNIALLGIFSAILASFSILMALIPGLSIVFGLFLPLVSAVAIYFTENKYIPFYITGAAAICIGITFFNIGDTLFFVIPSIISGSLFGFMRTKKILPQLNLFVIGLAQFVLHLTAYYLLIAITGINMVNVIFSFLGFAGEEYATFIIYPAISFMLAFSLGETGFNYLVIEGFLNKFSEEAKEKHWITRLILSLVSVGLGILCIVLGRFERHELMIFFVISTYFSLSGLDMLFMEKKAIWIYVLLGFSFLLSMILAAIINPMFDEKFSAASFAVFPICLSVVTFVSIIENKMAQ